MNAIHKKLAALVAIAAFAVSAAPVSAKCGRGSCSVATSSKSKSKAKRKAKKKGSCSGRRCCLR